MRYRIIKRTWVYRDEEHPENRVYYYIQWRGWFCWWKVKEFTGTIDGGRSETMTFDDLQSAKEWINTECRKRCELRPPSRQVVYVDKCRY